MCLAWKGSKKCGGCHEAKDHSRVLSGQFYSCTDQGFGCDRCARIVLVFLGSVCSAVEMGGGRPLSSFDERLSMAVLTASRWILLIGELLSS